MRILLVEDDPDLAEVVALGLRNAAYAVDVAAGCAEAHGGRLTVRSPLPTGPGAAFTLTFPLAER